jgi:hypothetical protein
MAASIVDENGKIINAYVDSIEGKMHLQTRSTMRFPGIASYAA